ncbi:GGDEF domain-containing protein [Methylobacterium currus]|uniref:GGDEF domain-containing protein n=1 Tax=Methylobacterium currus TaxID=2051553 RepID=UPI001E44BA31|nr:GGDEF domain-containing protein [Methylobacterium currus]UHC16464.1 GGDEF domain-containing protein [Methylobacterium currus]
MQIDLPTLYYLTVGTLLVAAAMTLWERQAHPRHARTLGFWAASYGVTAAACLVAMNRGHFPAASGLALASLLFVLGYGLLLHGVTRLDGQGSLLLTGAGLAAVAALWIVGGTGAMGVLWHHVGSVPVALACGLTGRALLRNRTLRGLRSRAMVIAVAIGHGLFYLARAVLAPLATAAWGEEVLTAVAKLTMYEGVLFSVAMPMGLLALVREEAQGRLLIAARTDYLTGLLNRHGFFDEGTRILAARRPDQPVSLLAFDLDHFKAINDRHGHAAGDTVLRLFADTARRAAGPDALIARLGGEEFAALLPGFDLAAAQQVGEAVAHRFAEAALDHDGPGIPATVSIGLAAAQSDCTDLPALLSAADRALYRAKAAGRNRLEVAAAA